MAPRFVDFTFKYVKVAYTGVCSLIRQVDEFTPHLGKNIAISCACIATQHLLVKCMVRSGDTSLNREALTIEMFGNLVRLLNDVSINSSEMSWLTMVNLGVVFEVTFTLTTMGVVIISHLILGLKGLLFERSVSSEGSIFSKSRSTLSGTKHAHDLLLNIQHFGLFMSVLPSFWHWILWRFADERRFPGSRPVVQTYINIAGTTAVYYALVSLSGIVCYVPVLKLITQCQKLWKPTPPAKGAITEIQEILQEIRPRSIMIITATSLVLLCCPQIVQAYLSVNIVTLIHDSWDINWHQLSFSTLFKGSLDLYGPSVYSTFETSHPDLILYLQLQYPPFISFLLSIVVLFYHYSFSNIDSSYISRLQWSSQLLNLQMNFHCFISFICCFLGGLVYILTSHTSSESFIQFTLLSTILFPGSHSFATAYNYQTDKEFIRQKNILETIKKTKSALMLDPGQVDVAYGVGMKDCSFACFIQVTDAEFDVGPEGWCVLPCGHHGHRECLMCAIFNSDPNFDSCYVCRKKF